MNQAPAQGPSLPRQLDRKALVGNVVINPAVVTRSIVVQPKAPTTRYSGKIAS